DGKSGNAAARPLQALHEALRDRIGNRNHDNRYGARDAARSDNARSRIDHEDIGPGRDQLFRKGFGETDVARGPAIDDLNVVARFPSELLECLVEGGDVAFTLRVVFGTRDQHTDALLALALLRMHEQGPADDCPADESCELPPPHAGGLRGNGAIIAAQSGPKEGDE